MRSVRYLFTCLAVLTIVPAAMAWPPPQHVRVNPIRHISGDWILATPAIGAMGDRSSGLPIHLQEAKSGSGDQQLFWLEGTFGSLRVRGEPASPGGAYILFSGTYPVPGTKHDIERLRIDGGSMITGTLSGTVTVERNSDQSDLPVAPQWHALMQRPFRADPAP